MQNDVLLHFSDENKFYNAVQRLQSRGVQIRDYHTPYSLSESDADGKKINMNSIGAMGVIAGLIGAMLAFILQLFLHSQGYTITAGGINLSPSAAYMPLVLEGTLLFSGVAMFVQYRRMSNKQNDVLSIIPESDQYYIVCSSDNEEQEQAIAEVTKEAVE